MEGSKSEDDNLIVLLISGPIASGKSTVTNKLISAYGFESLSSGDYLRSLLKSKNQPVTRKELQELGDSLDIETNYGWLAERISKDKIKNSNNKRWIIDCVRKAQQISSHKDFFGTAIIHIHITADPETLKARYLSRATTTAKEYNEAKNHINEISSEELINIADLVLSTANNSIEEVCNSITKKAGIAI
ncbi:ATP-binding protein [Pseudomonas viridiflava]|uniref:ATP-binding protein n=1 Tax=Pseudomonas viridiflava TaxID=33069 RepID=UPI000F03CC3A|nr:ATP-binding protein [Pseudomonas viridiflava]